MNVGIWIRVSTEDQARGESPKNHEHRARMYAELKNWDVIELYDLSGVSGKSVIDHPEAKRMLADVAAGKIKALIFSKLARLARNVRELLDIADRFQLHGANLVSLEESIDTSTPAGRLLFTVIGALAQWEREEISARVSASVPVRARQGKPTGGKGPFGYVWQDKQLVINPAEAPMVRALFDTFMKLRKILSTAEEMNRKGLRTRNGAKWGTTTVKRILTDPTYKGMKRANYSKSKGDKKSWALKPEKEWVFFEVEPLIAAETWNEVNAVITRNAAPYPATPPPIGKYAFSGLLSCGDCNKKMYVMTNKWMKDPRYTCRGCKSKVDESILFDQFREGLKCMFVTPEQLQGVHKADEQVIGEKENALKVLRNEMKTVDRKIDSLLDLVNDGSLDRKTFSEKIGGHQERKQQLEQEIPRLEGEIAFLKASELGKDYLMTQATTLYAMWDTINTDSRIKVAREMLNGITLTREEVNFDFFYLPEFMELCKPDRTHMGSWRLQA